MKTRKGYGYKVCYREKGKKRYVRYFLTYSYRQALDVMRGYVRDPPSERQSGRKLNNPSWKVIPVKRDEVRAGIWRENPF